VRGHALLNTTDDVQTLEEMDAAFGDYATDREREHMESICRELGLPAKALLSA
jgi:diphthamide synthase (EF-2-diphthine--ammonia ligase)